MTGPSWTLKDAKIHLSRVVAAAEEGEPQVVTKRGRRSVVILSFEEYERLCARDRRTKPSFVEHILSVPKRPPSIPDDEELFPREPFFGREIDFDE